MDKNTLQKAKNGDKAALGEIFDQYIGRVYRYAYVRINNKEAAEDLASAVFLKIIENLSKLDLSRNFEAWLFKITRNALIDMHRKGKFYASNALIEIAKDDFDEPREIENNILLEQVKELFCELKDDEREVLELSYFADLKDLEISNVINRPVGNIRVIRFRAVKKLQKLIKLKKNGQQNRTISKPSSEFYLG